MRRSQTARSSDVRYLVDRFVRNTLFYTFCNTSDISRSAYSGGYSQISVFEGRLKLWLLVLALDTIARRMLANTLHIRTADTWFTRERSEKALRPIDDDCKANRKYKRSTDQ